MCLFFHKVALKKGSANPLSESNHAWRISLPGGGEFPILGSFEAPDGPAPGMPENSDPTEDPRLAAPFGSYATGPRR